ncbi:hypothetical protein ACFCX4_27275 [Kitasatospora sp. NPDC056327]|uniref:hypothetical protein n=1 Tax=Kitasatospora sp. NPDC056327 TaxID=3345785 RepID=UPI0035DA4921
MGLSISVGMLHDQARNDPEGLEYHLRAFERLGTAVREEGIDWQEPPFDGPPRTPAFSGGFPYRYLTRLRRVLALLRSGEPVVPAEEDGARWERDCGLIQDEASMFSSHLICHADNAGYYVPVDFADPLFLPSEAGVAGAGMVGSVQGLLRELAFVAPALGITGTGLGTASAPGAASNPAPPERPLPEGPFEPERFAWQQLHAACLAALAGGHAIVFH